jgi:hypothetical protein
MSNDVILSQIKSQLADLQTGVDDDTRAVAGASSIPKRISIKGCVFRKIVGGKEVAALPDRHMNIIFAKMSPHPSRNFYPNAYVEDVKAGPECWSSDAVLPDPKVKNPPAKSCKECPNSIKGSGWDGKGTACRLSWRTAVVLPHHPEGDVMQLVIPAASVWGEEYNGGRPFLKYIQYLAENNISAGRVVTKMEFDLRKPSPTLLFSPVAAVPTDDVPKVQAQAQSIAAMNALIMTVFQQDDSKPAVIPQHQPVITAAVAEREDNTEPEPVLRETKKVVEEAAPPAPAEVSAVIKKWSKK